MKIYIKILLSLALTLSVCGCSTVFTGTTSKITVNSTPAGASVYDSNNALLGKTPLTTQLHKENRVIFLKKEGYQVTSASTERKFSFFPFALDIFCWPTLIVDAYTGACYDIRTNYNIKLEPSLSTPMQK